MAHDPTPGEPRADEAVLSGPAWLQADTEHRAAENGQPAEAPSLADPRRRTERWLIVGVGLYALIVVGVMFLGGLRITPDVLAVAAVLVAVLLGRTRLFLRDWMPFIAIFLAYELMRGIADDAGFPVHMEDVAALELWLFAGNLPTQILQDLFAPGEGVSAAAIVATVLYMLHFALPIVTGLLLWVWHRPQFHDYVATFILLSFSGFVTYLFLPVAPPWMAAGAGILNGPDGQPVIEYLKPDAFAVIAQALGYADGRELSTYVFYGINPNGVAAFPSLHAAYPLLSFLVLRRAFGRIGWIAFAYTLAVWWAIVFTGDHWVVDIAGGVAYALAAFYVAPRLGGWVAMLRGPDRSAPAAP